MDLDGAAEVPRGDRQESVLGLVAETALHLRRLRAAIKNPLKQVLEILG